MHMNLRQLRVFLEVAKSRSFSRAAQRLNLSQPAVSRYISELEADLGQRLIERTTRTVDISAAGLSLQIQAEPLLDLLESTLVEFADGGSGVPHVVRVVLGAPRYARMLAPCLAWCQRRYPMIRVLLHHASAASGLQMLALRQADFALTWQPTLGSAWRSELVGRERLQVACPRQPPWYGRGTIKWQELARQQLVVPAEDPFSAAVVEHHLRLLGLGHPAILEMASLDAARRRVQEGVGVGLWPAWSWRPAELDLLPLTLEQPLECELFLVRCSDRPMPPTAHLIWMDMVRCLTLALT